MWATFALSIVPALAFLPFPLVALVARSVSLRAGVSPEICDRRITPWGERRSMRQMTKW